MALIACHLAATAVLTYRGKEIWSWARGMNPSTGKMVTPDAPFRIGSISKLFAALLGLLADSYAIISMDEPVKTTIKDLSMIDPFHEPNSARSSSFSWRQLASHTAGIPREAPCAYHSCQRTDAEMMSRLKNVRLILPSASRPSYSNLGYAMLGHFVAQAMKGDYENLISEAFLKPLDMKNTSFAVPSSFVTPVPDAPVFNLGWLAPSGQMFSSARDLAKLAIAINLASSDPYLFGNPRIWDSSRHSSSSYSSTTQSPITSHFHIGKKMLTGVSYFEKGFEAINRRNRRDQSPKTRQFGDGDSLFKPRERNSPDSEESRLLNLAKYAKSDIFERLLAKKELYNLEKWTGSKVAENKKKFETSSARTGINLSLLREFMFPTYVNPDGSGYGMPWEFVPIGKYGIRNKGANLQGYSSNIALVPELQIGLTLTTNFNTDSSEWSNHNLKWLIPELENILEPLQSSPPSPATPERYIGKYDPSTEISLNEFGHLAITKLKGMSADVPLVSSTSDRNNPSILQFYLPQMALPCMDYEYAALGYEYVEFVLDPATGRSKSFTIPGLMYSDTFVRSN